jgi:hypothetical protein
MCRIEGIRSVGSSLDMGLGGALTALRQRFADSHPGRAVWVVITTSCADISASMELSVGRGIL